MQRAWIVAAGLMLVVLAGCNPTDEKKTDTGGTTTPPKTGQPPKTPTATGPAGAVKLGFCFEESGDSSSFGKSSRNGAEMAIDELNKAGGLFGKNIDSVFEDNASKPDQAATAASKLVNEDKVNAVIGCVASSNSLAMAKIVEAAKIPMISPASTKVTLTLDESGAVRKYIFRTCFTDDFQGEAMVDFAINGPLKAKKAVIFYASDNDYAKGIYQTVKDTAPKKGLDIVAEDSFLSSSETDFRTKLAKFKSLDFDVLIVPGYYKEASEIANQARELGLKQPLLGGDGFDSPDLWKNAGKNIEGSYFTNHYAADDQDPAVQEFITKYKARYAGNTPDAMAILAYDCVNVVAAAFKAAGSTDAEAVTAALAATKDFKGAAGNITIDAKHNATKKLVVMQIGPNGALKWVYTYNPGQASGGSAAKPGLPGAPGAASKPVAGGAPVPGAPGGKAPTPTPGGKAPAPGMKPGAPGAKPPAPGGK